MCKSSFDLGSCKRKRILVESSPGVWRYIAKIIPYGLPDGGFALVPSYEHNEVGIFKIQLLDTFSHLIAPPDPIATDYQKASNRIKISFHHDGATQISGADTTGAIISGRHKESGEFKGLGILGRPFSAPTFTGAVLGMTAYGLSLYPRTNITKNTIRFSRDDIGRKWQLSRGAVILEIYLMHRKQEVEFYKVDNEIRCHAIRWNGATGLREKMDLRVFNLRSEEVYLGVRCYTRTTPKTDGNISGYMLSTQRDKNTNMGLLILCPPPRKALNSRSLDRGLLRPKVWMPLGRDIDK
ncbi:hypothetical protein [Acetobacter sp. KSO5]|uniref:hypothetical protein n=1 Tax=Acetobacter sp. KSO5 TaxID=3373674 RepID=UPI00376EBB45